MKIAVVIPAFNEEKVIGRVLDEVKRFYPNVYVVDDASDDGTVQISRGHNCLVLEHLINRGQGAALRTGIMYALRDGAEVIVTFDADGQHQVQDIVKLLEPIFARRCEVVLGSRFLDPEAVNKIPTVRRRLLQLAIIFTRITTRLAISDTHNGLRAMTAAAARKIKFQQDRFAHASEILESIKQNHLTYTEVPVTINYSSYSLQKGQKFGDFVKILLKLLLYKLK